jgi:DNA-binding XRE family transcriptional regulator
LPSCPSLPFLPSVPEIDFDAVDDGEADGEALGVGETLADGDTVGVISSCCSEFDITVSVGSGDCCCPSLPHPANVATTIDSTANRHIIFFIFISPFTCNPYVLFLFYNNQTANSTIGVFIYALNIIAGITLYKEVFFMAKIGDTLGNNLQQLRKNNHLTQKQVAQRIGVSVSVISSYEVTHRTPSYDVLIKLANLYHTTTDYLLGRTKTNVLDLEGLSPDDIKIVTEMVEHLREKNR